MLQIIIMYVGIFVFAQNIFLLIYYIFYKR